MRKLLRFGSLGLAATLVISACAAPTPTTTPTLPSDEPAASDVLAPNETLAELPAPAFPEDVAPLPMAPTNAQPPVTVKGNGLVLPTGGNVSLDNLYQDLPPSIPQDEASQWLGPLPGAIAEGFGGVPAPGAGVLPGGAYGAFPGVIPDLLTYNALARCLYFPYGGFYVPYYLVGGAYYPYTYSPYYDTLYSGYYAYPLFYGYGGYCYPYTFLASNYWYGFADWEYYWPLYRSRYSHHRYRDDYDAFERRGGSRHFKGWISKRGGNDNWRERYRSNRRDDWRDGQDRDHRAGRGDGRHGKGSEVRQGRGEGRHGKGSEVRQGRDESRHGKGSEVRQGRGKGQNGNGSAVRQGRGESRNGKGSDVRQSRGQRSGGSGKHDGGRRGGKH